MNRTDLAGAVKAQIQDGINTKQTLIEHSLDDIVKAGQKIIDVFKRGNKLLLCGNGGSAADAQHIAAEFAGRFQKDRPGLPAIALTANTSIITAISNDYGYEKLFSKQVQALGKKGDVLIAISTSGRSPNVIEAVKAAAEKNMFTIGLTGIDGGRLKSIADLSIIVSSYETPRIQEAHILIGHILCAAAEDALFK